MEFDRLPADATSLLDRGWKEFAALYEELAGMDLTDQTVNEFLSRWSRVSELVTEVEERLYVAKTADTADEASDAAFKRYLDDMFPQFQAAEQDLKSKLLDSGLKPRGFEVQIQEMRAEADLFREENLPLLAEDQKLGSEYQEIVGAQTVQWRGEELPLPRLLPFYEDHDRGVREEAWKLASQRRLEDHDRLGDLWGRFYSLRKEIAGNAGLPSFREYRWKQLHRFDYAPEDNLRFHDAILETFTPAAGRISKKRQERLGVESLRPWDLFVDFRGSEPLHPFAEANELIAGVSSMFHKLDTRLGATFDQMRDGDLLDLDSRMNKAPGGYCTSYSAAKKPFIFMNASGIHADVQTLLHESGHAFHVFETASLPFRQQRHPGHEFAEVASMSMELLAAPYLSRDRGGFYTPQEAARAQIDHLETILLLLPRMMYIDAFQHWAYANPEQALDVDRCDETYARLNRQFAPYVDYSGLEADLASGWQAVLHIFEVPFYIIEYAMAQTAALYVWTQSRSDPKAALERYRSALALGNTRRLPDLFAAVGAPFSFTIEALRPLVETVESAIEELEAAAA